MKRITFLLFIVLFLSNHVVAQTPWAKKAAGAVFTLKTFNADGQLLAGSNGFFVTDNGEALSSFTPFKGAARAVVIDAQGKELPVLEILGANDTYDVVRFRVDAKKTVPLTIARATSADSSTVWLLPYSVKKVPVCPKGTIVRSEPFATDYAYYTVAIAMKEQQVGCPLMNADGQVIGLMQQSAATKDHHCYAVSASYANSLRIGGLSINDATLRQTSVQKALPDTPDEALVSLFMASSMDSLHYADYINRFIQKFPNVADGYLYRARFLTSGGHFAEADAEIQKALKVSDQKDDTHSQYALIIYQKVLYQADKPYEPWTLDVALDEARQAWKINPQPVYRQQQAQILFAQQKYDDAYTIYMELVDSDFHKAETFYAAAQCKRQAGDNDACLALLDSAVNTFSKPYLKAAAPYLLARAQQLHEVGKYRPAVVSFNEYADLMPNQLTADFYYLREQSEFAGHLYQQALDDIRRAVQLNPVEPAYQAEKACVELRCGLLDEAIETSKICIGLDAELSDGYLFLGIAQCLKNQKTEGVQNLQKAKELGNSQAQTFIDKYSK